MKKVILIVLTIFGVFQSIYYNISEENNIEKYDCELEEKSKVEWKEIIKDLEKNSTMEIENIDIGSNNYTINLNFKGNFNELKKNMDFIKKEYRNCTYSLREMNKENNYCYGKIAVNIVL